MQNAATRFRQLHQEGCFVIPNPWDVGTTIFLEQLGFPALATTSAGFAFAHGLPDRVDALSCDRVLDHVKMIVEATSLPVNADFQSGYAETPAGVRENVRRCAATGVAGLSIEDSTGNPDEPLFDPEHAVERLQAARAGIDEVCADVVLTGRAECFLVGRPDLDEVLRRLEAYSQAGADCLYAPGLATKEQIATVVEAVAPKPVNVLMSRPTGLTLADLEELGVRRVSVGSALARVAWGGFLRAAKRIAADGQFDQLAGAASFEELNALFEQDLP